MKEHPAALCIHAKDVQHILRISGRQARHILSEIRKKYGKQKFQPVTVAEFCLHMQLKAKYVMEMLQ